MPVKKVGRQVAVNCVSKPSGILVSNDVQDYSSRCGRAFRADLRTPKKIKNAAPTRFRFHF
jgi:hypothetical protein